jgi:hypothetical protein
MFQKTIFAQIVSFVDHNEFNRCVERYDGDKGVKGFSCHDQFLCMVFSQLAKKRSLRDTVFTLNSMKSKLYHMGIRSKRISRSTLAEANQKRNWKIFQDYGESLISKAQELYADEMTELDVHNNIYAIDSTTVDLCLSVYEWAKFRKTKSGIKLHTVIDLKGSIPCFVDVTEAIVSDNKFLEKLKFEENAIYLMNRGYCDFEQFSRLNNAGSFFVTRLKRNISFRRQYSREVDKTKNLIFDQIGILDSKRGRKLYSGKVRVIKYYDSEHDVMYKFLTNNFDLRALTIAFLYKQRWKIELFFKWIKQNLHIESFFGETENALKLQIWIAICAYLLIAILRKTMKISTEMSQILHFLSNVLFEQTPIQSLISNCDYKTQDSRTLEAALQLNFFTGH